jgi:hypothetical protein
MALGPFVFSGRLSLFPQILTAALQWGRTGLPL